MLTGTVILLYKYNENFPDYNLQSYNTAELHSLHPLMPKGPNIMTIGKTPLILSPLSYL